MRPRPDGKPKACAQCGKSFVPWNTLTRFCSGSCAVKAQHAPVRAARARPCAHCAKPFVPPGVRSRSSAKFCSRKCYEASRPSRLVQATCANCRGIFRRDRAQVLRTKVGAFCSRLCFRNWYAGENHRAYRGADRILAFGPAWARLAEVVRERDGRKCRRCGITEAEAGRRHAVDHLIPRRAFTEIARANVLDNLASLCLSCHMWKTRGPEARWLAGDALDLLRFIRSIGTEPVLT